MHNGIMQPLRLASIVLLACSGCGDPGRDPATVVFASGSDLESANPLVTVHPLARQVQRYALFVTLAQYDSLLQPRPYFARSWNWNVERTELTLALASGVLWHDGVATTARDVAYTLQAARDPATGYYRAADLAGIVGVRVPDDSTVVVRFASPQPLFPGVLCELPIVPAHRLAGVAPNEFRRHAFATAPLGNGPFRFVRRDAGTRWVFERAAGFPALLGGPPAIERLVIAVVDEPATKFAGLVSGDLHVAGIAPTMADLARDDPTLGVLTYPVLFATALVFNTTRPPFDDARVRRAVSAALDRQRIVDVALAGFATPSRGAVSPDNPRALALPRLARDSIALWLAAAGWSRNGDGPWMQGAARLAFTVLTVGTGDNAIEQLLQADLRAIGIDVSIRQLELGAFLTTARATPKTFDALVAGVPGDLALSYLVSMFDSRYAGGALDYAGFHTPELDSRFAALREATSPAALDNAWRAVQLVLERETPAAWLYHSRGVQGVARRLRNVRMDLRGELVTLTQWRLAGASD
ncbi:MAG: ABC transporter substrate-binding protein [Gemmatimonadaceae bacterium]